MKRIILTAMLLWAATSFAAAQPYFYFDKSRTAIKTVYDGKGQVIGTQEYRVVSQTHGTAVGSNTIIKPGKDTEVTQCGYFMDGQILKIAMGKNAEGKEVFLDYGPSMCSATIVAEISFETTARLAGSSIRVSCAITNRIVKALHEKITSPAGEWNCIRTEYDMELRGRIFGIGIPVNVHIIEWYACGTGVVRTDIYRRGKLHESRLLTGYGL